MSSLSPLTGKVALVTGGSRGIGAAIVRRLARDGADVAFSYAQTKDKADEVVASVESLGRRAVADPCRSGRERRCRTLGRTGP